MTRGDIRKALARHGAFCEWCGIGINPSTAQVVERPPGPVPFCPTCIRRYENPEGYPYLRLALRRKGL